jgi:NAD+ kinase
MKVAIVANTGKAGIKKLIPRFVGLLGDENIEAVLDSELEPVLGDSFPYEGEDGLFCDASMIVSFGGDGTILYTARRALGLDIPILGINLGKVGFLAELSPGDIDTVPERLKRGSYEIIDRMAFRVDTSKGKTYFALNDVVIDRNADSRILGLTMKINDDFAGEITADGLIIATPTGSTAHSISAGGPLVMPDNDVFILSTICPHSLTMRPLIVSGDNVVTLGVENGVGRMAVDGQSFIDVPPGCEVMVQRAESPVRVARFTDKTYFDILHTRLRWGVSLKMKNA